MAQSAISQSISALETLSFILPGPWGPIASAALHLLGSAFDPQAADPDKPILDAIKDLRDTLQTYIVNNRLKESHNYVGALNDWVNDTSTYHDIDTNPATLTHLINAIGSNLDPPINAITPVVAALDVDIPQVPAYEAASQEKISTLIALRASMASILNYRVILQQKLTALYQEGKDTANQDKVKDALDELVFYFEASTTFIANHIAGTTVTDDITARCDEVKSTLQKAITAVVAGGSPPAEFSRNDVVSYAFTDTMTGKIYTYANTYSLDPPVRGFGINGGGLIMPDTWTCTHDARADADAARVAVLADIATRCDAFKADALALLLRARKIMADTKADPSAPRAAPDVDYDNDTAWPKAWQFTGKYVRYAVLFQGETANTPPSDYSDWHKCDEADSYCPSVSLPKDPAGLAVARIVLRQVNDSASERQATTYLIPIPNMTSDTLVDLCPVDLDDVAPNALIAPVMVAAAYNANDPRRTWPEPYQVRYRYAFQRKTKGGAVLQSPAYSPWSVPFDPAACVTDAEGYSYMHSYYSPLMLVPSIDDCDVVLQRQFKTDQKPLAIPANVSKAAAAGTVFVGDATGP